VLRLAGRLLSALPMKRGRIPPSGFTVLELLAVLGVLATVVAIGAPAISAVVPGVLVNQAARRLAADLQLARVQAINRNTRVRTTYELSAARYRVEAESEARFVPEGGARALPPGVAFDPTRSTRVSGGQIAITFLPRGNTSDNATIALAAAGGAARRVIVSSAGRIRVQ
jgi:type IV fimbrial biogenesis protein FimT